MPEIYDPEAEKDKSISPEQAREMEDWYKKDAPDIGLTGEKTAKPDELAKAEKDAGQSSEQPEKHENIVGGGYKPSGGAKTGFSRYLSGRRKRYIIGGGVAAGIAALLVAIFTIFILPLKILHIVNNLQDRFYGTSQVAQEKMVDRLFSRYLLGKVTAGCKGVYIDHTCNPYDGKSYVGKLYRGWSDGRLETNLKDKTGLEIRKTKNSNRYEMRFVGGDSIDLDGLKQNKTISEIIDAKGDWAEVKKNKVKGVYKSALKTSTRHSSVMFRVKVVKYLGKKYGIKFCTTGCITDKGKIADFKEWKNDKKFGAKMWLAERVLLPRSELYAMIMRCLWVPDGTCNKANVIDAVRTNYSATVEDGCTGGCTNGNGRAVSIKLTEMETKLASLAVGYGSDYKSLRKTFDLFEKNGFRTAMFKSLVTSRVKDSGDENGKDKLKNNDDVISRTPAATIRALGWMVLAAQVVQFLDEAPQIIARLQYITNSTAMVQTFATYRTHADEIKEGQVDAALVGSFVTSLGPGLQPTETVNSEEGQVGGTASAEATPLYKEIVSEGPYKEAGIAGLLQPKILAAEATEKTSNEYLCRDENNKDYPIPANQLICDEEKLNGSSWFADKLELLKKIPGWGLLATVAKDLNSIVNKILKELFDFLDSITGGLLGKLLSKLLGFIADLVKAVAKYTGLGEVLKAIAGWMLGINLNMVSNNMSGGRTFDMMAGGADVSGNDFAHHGLGGVALSKKEMADNINYLRQQRYDEYQNQPFFARIFNTESIYSPVSQLALAVPFGNFSNIPQAVISKFFKNPLGKFFGSLTSPFSKKAGAAGFIPGKDPFGVTQYGYPLDDTVFKEDPDEYWKKYCTDTSPYNLTSAWNDFAARDDNLNPETYEPENWQTSEFASGVPGNKYGTNGCLLIQTAVGSAGAIFTDEVLSPEELATGGGGGGGGGPLDCNAPSDLDQSPGDIGAVPAEYRPFIAAAAEGMTCPDYVKPSGAFPATPGTQYFAACSDNCAIQGTKDGRRYIQVKYRDPPGSGNTINELYVDP